MRCSNCNYESDADFMFCPNCGTPQQAQQAPQQPEQPQQFTQQPPQQFTQQPPQQFQQQQFQQQQYGGQQQYSGPQGYGAPYQAPQPQPLFYGNGNERILAFFKDTLFLVITILFSVTVLCKFLTLSIPVIEILYTIFFWIIFVSARKNQVTSNQVKWVSGTTFAKVIINYVTAGFVLILGFILMAGASALGGVAKGYSGSYGNAAAAAAGSVGVIGLVVCIIVAAIIVLITILGVRPIHRFVKSGYKSLEAGSLMAFKPGTAKVWLMIFGILNGLSAISSLASGALMTGAMNSVLNQVSSRIPVPLNALGITTGINIFGFLSSACLATAYIMLSITIGKYFGDVPSYEPQQQQMQ